MDLARLGFDVDTGGLRKGQKELKGLSGQSQKTEKSVGNLGRTIRNLAGALAVGAAFRTVIRNTIEQERVTAQLNQTLKSTGRFTEDLSQGLQDYASELQNVTTYGDEAIISAQAMLLTFTQIGEEAFPRAQEAVLDLATAMGTDLKSATVQVGKALNDPVLGLTALQRSGIQFSETQKEMIKDMVAAGDAAGAQAAILDELETQFGGSARAARDTLGGALQSLKNAFGDLLEGDSGGEGINGATGAINDLTDLLSSSETKEAFGTLTEAILEIISLTTKAVTGFVDFGKAIGETVAEILHGTNDVSLQLAELWNEENELVQRNNELKERGFKKYGRLATEYRKNQERILEIEQERAKLQSLQNLMDVGGGSGSGADSTGSSPPSVPRVAGGGDEDDDPAGVGGEDDIREQMERRRNALLQSLETEKNAILRAFGERDAEIKELEEAGIEQGGITAMQAAHLRVQNEQEKQARLTELADQGAKAREEIERGYWDRWLESAESNLQNFNQLSESVINNFTSGFGSALESIVFDFQSAEDAGKQMLEAILRGTINTLGQMAAQWLAYQAVQAATAGTAAAAGATAMTAEAAAKQQMAALGAFASTAAIPVYGPAAAPGAAAAALAATSPFVAAIAGLSSTMAASAGMASFDGGGYTGNGSRSGGMDGKGGFLAMMHPRETVVDHTKGGSASSNSTNVTQVFQLSDNARREAKQQILESAPMIQQMAKQAVLQAISQGGAMSRAVGRRS